MIYRKIEITVFSIFLDCLAHLNPQAFEIKFNFNLQKHTKDKKREREISFYYWNSIIFKKKK